jgi:alanyl-tRNA synthetase
VTVRLYYTDSYLAEFAARVVSVDGTRVYLDGTAFYPTSGGQPHDLGVLGGIKIADVLDEETRVAHVLESSATFLPGAEVKGTLDWTRRFDHMQQHTGQHLLSALFDDRFGYKTVSVHFGPESSTLDLDTESLATTGIAEVEQAANQVVLENRQVGVAIEEAATAAGLRKPSERTGGLRVVAIEGLDRSACGGTHVRSTCEIGPVVIRRVEKTRKLNRVEFLCGWRAIRRAHADFDALTRMAATMTASIDDLPALVESQAASLRAADAAHRKLADEVARYRARELYDTAPPDASGMRRIEDRTSSMDELRAIAQAMSRLPRVLFVGAVASPPAVVFAASQDSGVNAGAVLKSALASRGGRGGGSPTVAQGSLGDAASMDVVVSELLQSGGA